MRGALQGPGALGTTGFFPGEGSPVVLDLGAVSQDGSPHGRPARPASLAGAVRAVRAAGLVPVGVCNTSHDVLRTASEQGLPEVMMVQARPRSSQQSSAPVTAETLRATGPSATRRPSVRPPASSAERSSVAERSSIAERSSVPAEELPSDATADAAAATPSRHEGEDGSAARLRGAPADSASPPPPSLSRSESVVDSASASPPPPRAPPAAASGARAAPSSGEARAAGAGGGAVGDERGSRSGSSVEGGAGAGAGGTADARDSSCEGFGGLPEQTRDRETMVYQGSVRSGQQVFAEGTSLVVLGAVSSGGEVMADGDIHVYGTLRGRALAGLSGNKSAKIFATRFDAELVGVGDTFTTLDDPESLAGLVVDTPTNVCLRDNKLVFRSFDLSATHT